MVKQNRIKVSRPIRNELGVVITGVFSHRNGIGGRPFDAITFTYEGRSLVAIVPDNALDGECFVTEPSNPDSCWRGDRFQKDLVKALKVFSGQ